MVRGGAVGNEEAGGATVFLFATRPARPLYEKLRFRAVGRSASFVG